MAKKSDHYAVILVGGSGTRFWPLSRAARPKQFLSVVGTRTLLEETVARLIPQFYPENILLVTNAAYRAAVARQVRVFDIPCGNILCEPTAKNTAPAICWAAAVIHGRNPRAVMAVLPSDHLITRAARFRRILSAGFAAAARRGCLVTLGIVPVRPETGYGYIKVAGRKGESLGPLQVERFIEKPPLATAKAFLTKKCYFWNSGMFIWPAAVILDAFEKYLPEVYRLVGASSSTRHVHGVWSRLPVVSVDHGIMEKTSDVVVIPADDIGWSDLGSWESLFEQLPKDKNGNVLRGDVIAHGCTNTLAWSTKKLVATIGLDTMIVVETPDAVVVCRMDKAQHIKDVVSSLRERKRREI